MIEQNTVQGPMKRRKIEDVALEICRKQKTRHVWYGNPQLCHDIYDASGLVTARHPLNVIAAVISAIARSRKWRKAGEITHLGRRYPLYRAIRGARTRRETPCGSGNKPKVVMPCSVAGGQDKNLEEQL